MDIDSIVLEILDSEKFKSIEYLISTIRISYLEYLTEFRATNFKAQPFIAPLVDSVDSLFTSQAISMDSLLEYMFTVFEKNNRNGWFYYYYTTVINPSILLGGNSQQICCDRNVFMHIVTGFIIDYFGSPINLDIRQHRTNHNSSTMGKEKVSTIQRRHRNIFNYQSQGALNQTARFFLSARYRFATANII